MACCNCNDYHGFPLDWFLEQIKIALKEWDVMKHTWEETKKFILDYFKNLNVQEEVNNVFNEYIESGKINELLRNALISDLVSESLYKPFGQILSTEERVWNYSVFQQGFAIGEIEHRPVCCSCFTDNTETGNGNVIVFVYLDSGEYLGRYNIPSGHCNSCTFNETTSTFFIATGGGNSKLNTVLEVNTTGVLLNTYTLEASPWAIAWNRDKFYVTLPNGILLVCDNTFNIISRHSIIFNQEYVHQGMFADDLYLYYPCGNTRTISAGKNRNMIEVYYHDGVFYKTIEVYYPLEIEECAIYNNKCYAISNTQGIGLLFLTDLYKTNIEGYLGGWALPNNNNNVMTMFIDESYSGFQMDGSKNKPYSSLTWFYFLVPSGITELRLNILSDITAHPFSTFTPFNYSVIVNGNNHRIKRINWNSGGELVLNNFIIIGENNSSFVKVEAIRFVSNNLTIGEEGTKIIANRALEIRGSYELSNTTINCSTNGKTPLVYILGDGYIRPFKINSKVVGYALFGGSTDIDGSFPISKLSKSNFYGSTYKVNMTLNEDLDLNNLFFPCSLSVVTNSVHISNAPEGFNDSNIVAILCDYISENKSLLTLIKTDGTIAHKYNHYNL